MASLGTGYLGTVPAGFTGGTFAIWQGSSMGVGVFRGMTVVAPTPVTEGQIWPRGDYRPT